MSNVLLVEPDYRSKFPPLGLLRLATYHRERGDCVTFVRGRVPAMQEAAWHRVYVSSLFTWELPRTVRTVKYYLPCVERPTDIFVGGIGATLKPDFIRTQVPCTVVEGQLDRPNALEPGAPSIADYVPDYSVLTGINWKYAPGDAYFCRTTVGCVRKCVFCAVPRLEPRYRVMRNWRAQVAAVRSRFGEQQNLVILDNNVLATADFGRIVKDIREEGFTAGATRNKKKRWVDFNQGLDARFVTPASAKLLASICLSPVRLAFDYDGMEFAYRKGIGLLAAEGFEEFTNYVLFNHSDDPRSLYRRLRINLELSEKQKIRVTGFPMRYIPIDQTTRRHVGPHWHWRYLRGIQCVLLATHGMVSPNRVFFDAAFGESYEEFLEIISMPDRYIIYRDHFKDHEAREWRTLFRRLGPSTRREFLLVLQSINRTRDRKAEIAKHRGFAHLLEHYYPGGKSPGSERPRRRRAT